MGLILPPVGYAFSVSNVTGTPSATSVGTSFTAGANNGDGTAVSVISATAADIHYLLIGVGGTGTTSANSDMLLDVLVDPAGGTSWASLIDDLICGGLPALSGNIGTPFWYQFPIWIKAGSSIGVQARTAHTSTIGGQVVICARGEPTRPDCTWVGQKVESLGITAASSKGTDVTPGNTGADGSWTTIGTSTARYGFVQMGVNCQSNNTSALGFHWKLGVGSAQLPGTDTVWTANTLNESGARQICFPWWVDTPEGTVFQVMGTCSGTGAVHDCGVYGVY